MSDGKNICDCGSVETAMSTAINILDEINSSRKEENRPPCMLWMLQIHLCMDLLIGANMIVSEGGDIEETSTKQKMLKVSLAKDISESQGVQLQTIDWVKSQPIAPVNSLVSTMKTMAKAIGKGIPKEQAERVMEKMNISEDEKHAIKDKLDALGIKLTS